MKTHRAPENLFRMFDSEDTKPAGRQAVVDWLNEQHIETGDTVLIPHPESGEVFSFTKGSYG